MDKKQALGVTVTIEQDDLPQCGDDMDLTVTATEPKGQLKLKERVRFLSFDGYNRYETILELRNGKSTMLDWFRNLLLVYLTFHASGRALSNIENMNNCKLLNTASSTMLPSIAFMSILRSAGS